MTTMLVKETPNRVCTGLTAAIAKRGIKTMQARGFFSDYSEIQAEHLRVFRTFKQLLKLAEIGKLSLFVAAG